MTLSLLSVILIFIAATQLIYTSYFFSHFSFCLSQKKSETLLDENCPPVTVVLCFKNEAENLASHLPLLFEQDYPHKSYVLVNDHSSDQSVEVVTALLQKYPDISAKLIHLENRHGKKAALKMGVHEAENNLILVTDADGQPSGNNWIKSMAACQHSENADVVLGYGPLITGPSLVSKLAQAETIMTAMNYFSFACRNLAYMGVGRNMLFKKSIFLEADNDMKGKHLVSGDDDLFINALSNKKITFCLKPESFIWSRAKATLRNFWKQKTRHISTSFHYKPIHQFWLMIYAVPMITFWPLVCCSFYFDKNISLLIILIIIKYGLQYVMQHKAISIFSRNNFTLFYPVWEMILGFYYTVMAVSMMFRRNQW